MAADCGREVPSDEQLHDNCRSECNQHPPRPVTAKERRAEPEVDHDYSAQDHNGQDPPDGACAVTCRGAHCLGRRLAVGRGPGHRESVASTDPGYSGSHAGLNARKVVGSRGLRRQHELVAPGRHRATTPGEVEEHRSVNGRRVSDRRDARAAPVVGLAEHPLPVAGELVAVTVGTGRDDSGGRSEHGSSLAVPGHRWMKHFVSYNTECLNA